MGRRLVIELTEREAARLARGDWEISLGWGVKVPQSLVSAERRIRAAAALEVAADGGADEESAEGRTR